MLTTAESYSIVILAFNAREWLSGGAPPCQGGGRGFDPRLALFFTFSGVFCVCTYIWKILKLKHFPKKLIPYIKIRY